MDCVEDFFNECHDGNFSAVESFLLNGISPNIQNAEGETALQISAANGLLNIVNLLLKKGALVDLSNNYGWTPLMHAASYGHIEIVTCLIQMKAKVNICNKLGLRAIDLAAWSGNLACVKLLVEAGAVIDSLFFSGTQDDVCDMSPLMAASLRGHDILARFLLQERCTVDQASPITGLTPLMLAACNGHRTNVEILLEFGGDANKTDKCGRTALDLAVICGKDSIISFLGDYTRPNVRKPSGGTLNDTNILHIVRNGDIVRLKSILHQNPSLSNYVNSDDGVTPLMIACMLGFNNIVEVLIKHGSNLNAQDLTNGWTPLMYAVFHRQAETVNLLLDKGVNVDICTANGYTAIDLAIHADTSETDILGILLAYTESREVPDTLNYSITSPNSTLKSQLAVEKTSTRADSQGKFKDFLGGISSHLRQFSKSSTLSPTCPTFDSSMFEETLNDVFEDDATEQKGVGKFLCISKFYAPNERFAHLLKEQEVEAISLPPIPCHASHVNVIKNKVTKKKPAKPCFNSLRTPNLLRKYMKKNPVNSSQLPEQYVLPGSNQDFQKTPTNSVTNLRSSLLLNEFEVKGKKVDDMSDDLTPIDVELASDSPEKRKEIKDEGDSTHERNNQDETNVGGLTALLSQASLKKYTEKFRDQEIDLETFQYLTEDDLSEIGINSFDSRNQLLEIISNLKKS